MKEWKALPETCQAQVPYSENAGTVYLLETRDLIHPDGMQRIGVVEVDIDLGITH